MCSLTLRFGLDIKIERSEQGDEQESIDFTQIWPFPGRMSYIFAKNRADLSPDESITIAPDAGWTKTTDWTFDDVPKGDYNIQILWDQYTSESRINAPGNLY